MKIVVSACLIGKNCRYDGGNSKNLKVINRSKKDELIPVCPEEVGGLSTPRPAVEIVGGNGDDVLDGKAKVLTSDGEDKTAEFIKGAQYVLELVLSEGVRKVILKARSPSCGCGEIYDGTFSSTLISGDGVTTALLKRHGIEVISM
ncbi:DUF523 domain-containing protein [Candidatus Poribacteria bacterium]|nr:MAG: DUF523 domain-containing protein [Candidatus Poribacteria bacterium]